MRRSNAHSCSLTVPVVLIALTMPTGAIAPVASALAGENFAFLVSVKDYDEKELRPLQFTRNDVLEFERTLRDSGFRSENIVVMHDDVRTLENRKYLPEGHKIRQQLGLLLGSVDEGDTVVVALAGHGVQFRGAEQSYFCPADARLTDKETLLSFQELYAALKECRATRKLLLIDACRNDPQSALSRSRATVNLESITRPQREAIPEGIVALFSCSPGQQSYEHPQLQHGIFFHHLLKGWNGESDLDRDGRITFDELAGFVKRETTTYARRQLDVLQTPHLKSDASGDWVLRTLTAPTDSGEKTSRPQAKDEPKIAANAVVSGLPSAPDVSSFDEVLKEAENRLSAAEKARDDALARYQRNELGKGIDAKVAFDVFEQAVTAARQNRDELQAKRGNPVKGSPPVFFNSNAASSKEARPESKNEKFAPPPPVSAARARLAKAQRPQELRNLDAELAAAQKDYKSAVETLSRRRTVRAEGKGGGAAIDEALAKEVELRRRVESLQRTILELELKYGVR